MGESHELKFVRFRLRSREGPPRTAKCRPSTTTASPAPDSLLFLEHPSSFFWTASSLPHSPAPPPFHNQSHSSFFDASTALIINHPPVLDFAARPMIHLSDLFCPKSGVPLTSRSACTCWLYFGRTFLCSAAFVQCRFCLFWSGY